MNSTDKLDSIKIKTFYSEKVNAIKEKISFSIAREKTFAKEILDKGLFSKIWEEQKFDKKKKLKKKNLKNLTNTSPKTQMKNEHVDNSLVK